MTREEIVTALRCCASNKCGGCLFCNDDSSCISKMTDEAADLIENQQREIDALRQANEGLRFNLAAYANGERAVEDASPYAVTTDSADVGGGVPDAPDGDEICRAALEAFGAEAQITMVFEEMAELQDVLCKFLRGRVDEDTRTHIAEEIADVEIMLCQMKMLFDCAGQVETSRRYKLERLAERIKEGKKHEHE